jgi:hypothetical protein
MRIIPGALVAVVAAILTSGAPALSQVGTAFTYQGRLIRNGVPASGLFDLELTLWDAAAAGSQVGPTVTRANVSVASGLFTVPIDFGAGTFMGSRRWLQTGVRPGGTSGAFTTLAPRQELTPVANAIFAASAASAATVNGLACAEGQVAKWSGTAWACGTDVDTTNAGTVTSVAAGAGLSGGTITTAGTVAIATGGVTGDMIAVGAVGAAQIDASQVQTRLAAACPAGQFLRGVGADGSVLCETFTLPPTISQVDAPIAFSGVGSYSSIVIGLDGRPVISYYDGEHSSLTVLTCGNTSCIPPAAFRVADDPANEVGAFTSIAVGPDGIPVVSYFDQTAGSLKFARCASAACTALTTRTIEDHPSDTVGNFSSIAVPADGLPVISYHNATAGTLKVAKCVAPDCSLGTIITTVDDPVKSVGAYSSLALGTDGFPVISYSEGTKGSLRVAKCVNAACTGTSVITTVDDPPGHQLGAFTSIDIGADGFPVISYMDDTTSGLKVAKCSNAACTGSATITTVAGPNALAAFTSIAVGSDGLPIISYNDWTAGALKALKCGNAACSANNTITTVDASASGMSSAIAIGQDGLPVISYDNFNTGRLYVAKCRKASCTN